MGPEKATKSRSRPFEVNDYFGQPLHHATRQHRIKSITPKRVAEPLRTLFLFLLNHFPAVVVVLDGRRRMGTTTTSAFMIPPMSSLSFPFLALPYYL
jgi:hypothetical protein